VGLHNSLCTSKAEMVGCKTQFERLRLKVVLGHLIGIILWLMWGIIFNQGIFIGSRNGNFEPGKNKLRVCTM